MTAGPRDEDGGLGRGRSPRIRPFLDAPPPVPDFWAEPDATAGESLRPFILTSGRVRGDDPEIALETQVTALVDDPGGSLPPELRAIVLLCAAEPVSVAEISARLRLHLDVTKILVGDLRAAGYVEVHEGDLGSPTDPDTILRVIHGLRALT